MERASHQPLFSQSPLAQLALAFATGITLAHFLRIPFGISLVCSLIASLAAVLTLVKHSLSVSGCALLLAVLFAGAVIEDEQHTLPQSRLKILLDSGVLPVDEPLELSGTIDGVVDFTSDRVFFTLRTKQIRYQSTFVPVTGEVSVLVMLPNPKSLEEDLNHLRLRHGARLQMVTTLRRTDSYRNPGVSSFTEYLDRKGLDANSFVKSPALIQRLDDERGFIPLAWLYEWRQRLQREIDRMFSPETAGVLDAALLGNPHNLSQAAAEKFRLGGTFHVLVISGLHISFIGGLVFLVARKLTRNRGLQFGLSATVVWAYALAVGAEASVTRSALMFTIVALGPLIFRRAPSLNALGGTALALLVWQPGDLIDPSFQLTFLSVLAIVLIAWPAIQKTAAIGSWQPTRSTPYPPACPAFIRTLAEALFWSERRWQHDFDNNSYRCRLFKTSWAWALERCHVQRIARYVFNALSVSLSVQLMLLPLLVNYFHRISIASLILNIGVSLLMAVLAIVSIVSVAVAQVSLAMATPLISLANLLNWLMVHSVDPFARLDIASLRVPHYAGAGRVVYVLYYLPVIFLATALERWNPLESLQPGSGFVRHAPRLVLVQMVLVGVLMVHPFSASRADGDLHIDFLDVGQGDAAIVTMPDGSTLLIDGGGRPAFFNTRPHGNAASDPTPPAPTGRSIGEAVVSEYLWWRGLDSVDYVLATHADADHIDGLNDVVRNFAVRAALVARAPKADPEFQNFAASLRAERVPVFLIGTGDSLNFGAVKADVLWPPANDSPDAPSRNNDSITLLLVFSERKFLLTGDIEREAENAVLKSGASLAVDVVKVAHHGSKTSSTAAFVKATHPKFAIISVGRKSMFGHPSAEVVERWKASGASVLTTGNSGTITIQTDGRRLSLSKFVRE